MLFPIKFEPEPRAWQETQAMSTQARIHKVQRELVRVRGQIKNYRPACTQVEKEYIVLLADKALRLFFTLRELQK